MPASNAASAPSQDAIHITQPDSTTGWHVHQLIQRCPPLDTNSVYCNLLQASHFAATSAAAWRENQLVGFISGYIKPEQNDCYFLWQVACDVSMRGQGLAKKMLNHILLRPNCHNIRYLETTITEDNAASWALFLSFAKTLQCPTEKSVLFDKQQHFNGQHDSEYLLRIGPFNPSSIIPPTDKRSL